MGIFEFDVSMSMSVLILIIFNIKRASYGDPTNLTCSTASIQRSMSLSYLAFNIIPIMNANVNHVIISYQISMCNLYLCLIVTFNIVNILLHINMHCTYAIPIQ